MMPDEFDCLVSTEQSHSGHMQDFHQQSRSRINSRPLIRPGRLSGFNQKGQQQQEDCHACQTASQNVS